MEISIIRLSLKKELFEYFWVQHSLVRLVIFFLKHFYSNFKFIIQQKRYDRWKKLSDWKRFSKTKWILQIKAWSKISSKLLNIIIIWLLKFFLKIYWQIVSRYEMGHTKRCVWKSWHYGTLHQRNTKLSKCISWT